jgi:hypothetical protein
VVKKVQSYGSPASLPLSLQTKAVVKATQVATSRETDVNPATRKPALTPDPETRALANTSTYVDPDLGPDGERPPEVKSSGGVPKWVWVVVGVGLAAGAGVGGYFAIREGTRPVTGTVTASW